MAIETHGNKGFEKVVSKILQETYQRKQDAITELLVAANPNSVTDGKTLQLIMDIINN